MVSTLAASLVALCFFIHMKLSLRLGTGCTRHLCAYGCGGPRSASSVSFSSPLLFWGWGWPLPEPEAHCWLDWLSIMALKAHSFLPPQSWDYMYLPCSTF